MNLLLVPLIAVVAVALIFEFAAVVVYGWYADKEITERFLGKWWEAYMTRGMNSSCDMFYGPTELPYIAKFFAGVTATWHISEIGRIPRWSKWHKSLNEAQAQVKKEKREAFLKLI